MKKMRFLLQIFSYFALFFLLICNIYAEHSGYFQVSIVHKLLFAFGFFALWTLATFANAPPTHTRAQRYHRMRRYAFVLFVYYVWVLSNMLFFDASFGRGDSALAQQARDYMVKVNLQPLKTIYGYLRAYALGNIRPSIVAINLIGNLVAFAPMGIFLPVLFRPMRHLVVFFFSTGAIICAVEFLQFYTRTGSCDIDDLILNLAGALLFWLLIWLPFLRRGVCNATNYKGVQSYHA